MENILNPAYIVGRRDALNAHFSVVCVLGDKPNQVLEKLREAVDVALITVEELESRKESFTHPEWVTRKAMAQGAYDQLTEIMGEVEKTLH